MSTRGLLSLHFQGHDYVTYNHSDSYPRALGSRIVRFVQDNLHNPEAIQAFGQKVAGLDWVTQPSLARHSEPQGGELLEAIAAGKVQTLVRDNDLFQTCLDCEYAYILDLDEASLECWDLRDRVTSFSLATLSTCAVEIMEIDLAR